MSMVPIKAGQVWRGAYRDMVRVTAIKLPGLPTVHYTRMLAGTKASARDQTASEQLFRALYILETDVQPDVEPAPACAACGAASTEIPA